MRNIAALALAAAAARSGATSSVSAARAGATRNMAAARDHLRAAVAARGRLAAAARAARELGNNNNDNDDEVEYKTDADARTEDVETLHGFSPDPPADDEPAEYTRGRAEIVLALRRPTRGRRHRSNDRRRSSSGPGLGPSVKRTAPAVRRRESHRLFEFRDPLVGTPPRTTACRS